MKLLIPLMLVTISSFAQCKMQEDYVDEFSGMRTQTLDWQVLAKSKGLVKLKVKAGKIDNNYFFMANVNDRLGCVSSDSYIAIKFEDDSITMASHTSKIACGDYVLLSVQLTPGQVADLTTKNIKMIRYHIENTRDFIPVDPEVFKNLFKCFK